MQITDSLIHQLMYNALNIGVYGMIESKRKEVIKVQEKVSKEHMESSSGIQDDDLFAGNGQARL